MTSFKAASHVRLTHLTIALLLVFSAVAISAVPAVAQGVDSDLSKQLSQLQTQVMRLEAAFNHQPQSADSMTPQPNAAGNQATVQEQRTPGVPAGMQIAASFQNCLQCHQTRPAGPLPPSHLQALNIGGQGGSQAAGGQQPSGAGMGQMSQGGQAMQGGSGGMGMSGDKKMGMGMMGGDKKMGMGMMGGGKGMGMMGGDMKMGGGSQNSQGMGAMGGGDSMSGSNAAPIEAQLKSMQQQIQQLQQQVQQMTQIQMQMQLIQMKSMQSN